MGGYAWVTLATNDSYSLGALVLAHSLKKAKTAHKLVVLITPAVSQPMREQLQTVFDVVKVVDVLDSKDEAHLALMQRPELGITFTKIHCWRMTEFEKCVFLDADTLVVRNCDELFEREEFSAAPDVSWPDCFNSGVFVYKPSVETFNKLLQFAVEKGSFDGGDQGLLNQFFSDWATEDIKKHLPFVYNLTSVAAYSYVPAFRHYGAETRIVHFIGSGKPWLQQLNPSTRTITPTAGSEHLTPLLQQWWDLFCEKVHPALNKNLGEKAKDQRSKVKGDSNYDGMSHPPVEACSNTLPIAIALTDDSQKPRLVEPCTPYREHNDFRQHNLPYLPFDVKGSSGELLNVEFLLASVVQPTTQTECSEEQQRRQSEWVEERNRCGDGNEEAGNKGNETEVDGRETERLEMNLNQKQHYITEERVTAYEKVENGQEKEKNDEESQQEQQKDKSEAEDSFNFNEFFPDETCINNYLEQNVITYQPYDKNTHYHCQQNNGHHNPSSHQVMKKQNENHFFKNSENDYLQYRENGCENSSSQKDSQLEVSPPSLPRFLTIPEHDKRQSGNTETPSQPKEHETHSHPPPTDAAIEGSPEQEPQVPPVQEKRELTKSKSMSYLFDVTEMPPSRSVWKSQPDVSVEGSKRYSMPKLKPLLPRQSSLSKSVPSIIPKVTLYTEFFMSAEYKDPVDLPKDKVGFVETFIRKGQLRRSKSAADISDRFGPLPDVSPEVEQPSILRKTPLRHLDNELYDLSQCKRQVGNRPKAKADRKKENVHSLPALKPLLPQKEKKPTSVKKRKSKELSPNDCGREKMLKREQKRPKERKRETKIIPRNVSEASNGNNVDEILKKLREFSKNYQHFFEVPQRRSSIKYKNANVQVNYGSGTEDVYEISEEFVRAAAPPAAVKLSKATQTSREEKSDQQTSAIDLDFRQFRTYVQEKSKTSQKGLLSIQDLVSNSEMEIAGGVKVLSETVNSCSDLKWTKNKVIMKEIGNGSSMGNTEIVREVNVKNDKKTSECFTIDYRNFSKTNETAENRENSLYNSSTSKNKDFMANNPKSLKESTSHSKEDAKTIKIFKAKEPKPSEPSELFERSNNIVKKVSDDFSKSSSLPVVNGGKITDPSVQDKEIKVNDHEKEYFVDEKSRDVRDNSKSSSLVLKSQALNNVLKIKASEYYEKRSSIENNSLEPFPKISHIDYSESVGEHSDKEYLKGKLKTGEGLLSEVTTKILSSSSKVLVEKSKVNGEAKEERLESSESKKVEEKQVEGKKKTGKEKERKKEDLKEKVKKPDEILCVPDFDTPRSSRVTLLTTNQIGPPTAEALEKTITKITSVESQPTALRRPKARKNRKNASTTPHALPNGNTSPKTPPDGLSPPSSSSPSPPYVTPNGSAMPPDQGEDLVSRSGIAGAIAQLSLDANAAQSPESAASTAHQEYLRRQNWETGKMDYMGKDSFDNIWSKICQTLEGKELEEGSEKAVPAAVSPKPLTEPSAVIPTEGKETGKPEKLEPAATPSEVPTTTSAAVPTGPPAGIPSEIKSEVPVIIPSETHAAASTLTPIVTSSAVPTVVPSEITASVPTPVPLATTSLVPTPTPTGTSIAVSTATSTGICAAAPTTTSATIPSEVPAMVAAVTPSAGPTETPVNTTPTMHPSAPPTDCHKCPEYIDTLPGDAAAGPLEDDEIIFSNTDKKQSGLTNIKEEEEIGTKSSAEPETVKLSDILHPKDNTQTDTAPKSGIGSVKEAKTTEEANVPVPTADNKKTQSAECKTVAMSQPLPSVPSSEMPPKEEANASLKDGNSEIEKKATTGCTTVAIPSPPIVFPGAPFGDKNKDEKVAEKKSEPIPLPPPETPPAVAPEGAPLALQEDLTSVEDSKDSKSDPSKDDGKQKKGVFTKILEMVGVAPKEKTEPEISKSVFYDMEVALLPKQEQGNNGIEMAEPAMKTSNAEIKSEVAVEAKEDPTKQPEEEGKAAPNIGKQTQELKKNEDAVMPLPSKQASDVTESSKSGAKEADKAEKSQEKAKPNEKTKPPVEKPARSVSPKDHPRTTTDNIQAPPSKSKSPSPKLSLPQTPPMTSITSPTPPPQSDLPPKKNSALLKVDEAIPETPPVPQPSKEATKETVKQTAEETSKGKILSEVVDIIGKAKSEVESRLQDRRSAEKEPTESADLINTMKMMVGDDQVAQQPPTAEVEELRVTTEEDRLRHKGEVPSSKLSDQILKAIPPPRRKAISESASASAIPSHPSSPSASSPPPPSSPQTSAPQQKPSKGSKPSSIPVPPPRNRGKPQPTSPSPAPAHTSKPTPTTPSKGKPKK